MKTIAHWSLLCTLVALLPTLAPSQTPPAEPQPQWKFTTKNNSITIVKYTGSGGKVTIPGTFNGLPVTTIGEKAFFQCTNLTSVILPASVKTVEDYAFGLCSKLKGVYFTSSAPDFGSSVFFKDDLLTVYYLRGTSGWVQQCGDRSTAQWDPADQGDAAGGLPSP